MKDLVILAADKDLEVGLKGLLTRHRALGIRPVTAEIFVEPGHDPACALRGVDFMSMFAKQYRHGLLMFDHEGSGREAITREQLRDHLDAAFSLSQWGDRARTIVLWPELESWVWSDSPHVDDVMGWKGRHPELRTWLMKQGWLESGAIKPSRPKEAFEAALRMARKPRSSALYGQIAKKVSFRRCVDNAFLELIDILRRWFPQVSD